MDQNSASIRSNERWAQFRFSVIGSLLAAPPPKGELQARLRQLAAQKWRHPITAEWTTFGFSTIERWFYQALNSNPRQSPVEVLQRKIRADHGEGKSLTPQHIQILESQYKDHPRWSYRLHYDNLAAETEKQTQAGPMPSYWSVLRFMKSRGYIKRPRRGPVHSPGAQAAERRFDAREVRSYEVTHVNGLWHLDFHHGSLRVLTPGGKWVYPIVLGILDDHSRLCCHMQWYLAEGARELCHGLMQAIEKRGLPRSLLTDNGSAMIAKETEGGLKRLGILSENTLPYSPYQNGKQESWWGQVEGRLLSMLENDTDLTLDKLNVASQAWAEVEYNQKVHSETGQSPLKRYLETQDVGRPSPGIEELRKAFTAEVVRKQRRSDGSVSIQGRRFEVPSRYAHFETVALRFASWDLSCVYLCELKSGTILCRIYPQDKARNAEGVRAPREQRATTSVGDQEQPAKTGMAPLLEKIMRQYAATGLPPAYLPSLEDEPDTDNTNKTKR